MILPTNWTLDCSAQSAEAIVCGVHLPFKLTAENRRAEGRPDRATAMDVTKRSRRGQIARRSRWVVRYAGTLTESGTPQCAELRPAKIIEWAKAPGFAGGWFRTRAAEGDWRSPPGGGLLRVAGPGLSGLAGVVVVVALVHYDDS